MNDRCAHDAPTLYARSYPISSTAGRQTPVPDYIEEAQTLDLLRELAEELQKPGRGLQLREAAGKWRLETQPAYADVVASLRVERGERPLSQQAMSDFVLESALSRVEEMLTERRIFALAPDTWTAFQAALDAVTMCLLRLNAHWFGTMTEAKWLIEARASGIQ